jgi:hypothetical protein
LRMTDCRRFLAVDTATLRCATVSKKSLWSKDALLRPARAERR